jgi:hypothetical protein
MARRTIVSTQPCPFRVNRYRNAMSALRPSIPQSRTFSCAAASDAKGQKCLEAGPLRRSALRRHLQTRYPKFVAGMQSTGIRVPAGDSSGTFCRLLRHDLAAISGRTEQPGVIGFDTGPLAKPAEAALWNVFVNNAVDMDAKCRPFELGIGRKNVRIAAEETHVASVRISVRPFARCHEMAPYGRAVRADYDLIVREHVGGLGQEAGGPMDVD